MTRHYSPYDTATDRFADNYAESDAVDYDSYTGAYGSGDHGDHSDHGDYDDVEFYEETIDRRWIWVAAVAGAVLLVAVLCTIVILGGGDSGSVSATVAPTTPTSQSAPTTAQDATSTARPAPPAVPVPPPASLSPETVTTVTPNAPAPALVPAPAPVAGAPAEAAPPAVVAGPRTITYTVTGSRQLIDLVTIVYTDAQGALQTDINVGLPWSKTITLNPGVELKSVTATSVAGQLNCSVTDAQGTVLVQQANNAMIATCTQ